MKVTVYSASDQTTVINIRYTDEIGEELGLTDEAMDTMEDSLRLVGRYWVGDYFLARIQP